MKLYIPVINTTRGVDVEDLTTLTPVVCTPFADRKKAVAELFRILDDNRHALIEDDPVSVTVDEYTDDDGDGHYTTEVQTHPRADLTDKELFRAIRARMEAGEVNQVLFRIIEDDSTPTYYDQYTIVEKESPAHTVYNFSECHAERGKPKTIHSNPAVTSNTREEAVKCFTDARQKHIDAGCTPVIDYHSVEDGYYCVLQDNEVTWMLRVTDDIPED